MAPTPARHHTLIHALFPHGIRQCVLYDLDGLDDQGFLTDTGRFVNRREACRIVVANNQPLRPPPPGAMPPPAERGDDGELYSEDLW